MSKTNGQPKPDGPPTPENGWVKLYSPRGPQVTLPVTVERLDYAAMLANVHAMLDAGWLVAAPGLEEGEQKEEVGWILHGEHERDGEITPFVLLYANNDQLTWSFLKVYLNKPADVAAFEYASRMELAKVPLYNGQDKPQRGAAGKTDKFIIRAPKPFTVIFKPNPKHDPATEEGKMKPARLFVRWQDQPPAPKHEQDGEPPRPAGNSIDNKALDKWMKFVQNRPALEAFNDALKELSALDDATKRTVWAVLNEHAAQRQWAFDRERLMFAKVPQEAPA